MFGIDDLIGIGSSIFEASQQAKAQDAAIKLKQQEQDFQHALSGLSNEQTFLLNNQLNQAKNDTERYAILTNAVLQVKLQGNANTEAANNKNIYLIIALIVLAIIAFLIIKRNNDK